MAHPLMFDDADPLLARVREIALALPEAAEKITHGRPTFFTTKVFTYYGGRPRGDTADRHDAALVFRPDESERALLQAERNGLYGDVMERALYNTCLAGMNVTQANCSPACG